MCQQRVFRSRRKLAPSAAISRVLGQEMARERQDIIGPLP